MAGLRGREDALYPGEVGGSLKDLGLLHAGGLNEAVVVELADHRAHAVVPQAAGMVGRGDEAGAQGIHLGQGADHAGVTEVIGKLAPGKAGAGGRLHGDDPVVGLAPEHLAHEGGDQTTHVGPAAGAADDDVRLDAILVHGGLGLQPDDALVEENLVEDGP